MRKLLNTLFVSTQGAYLARERESVLVRIEHETRLRLPIHTLQGIVCFGQVSCSPPLMGLAAERGVLITHLTEYGRFLARVSGPVSGNVLLRREQYRRTDCPEASANIARNVVIGKVANARQAMMRAAREMPNEESQNEMRHGADKLASILQKVRNEETLDQIRGREGEAAAQYFARFDHFISHEDPAFRFTLRNRRPPLDPVNAMLSFAYTLLVHDCTSACETVGLDPCVGFLHRDRPGRPSLALDLMEELRAWMADRLVLTLINRKQVKPSGFTQQESGSVKMDDATRKTLLTAWQERKREEITHPFLDEKIVAGMIPYVQALLLARHLRGDLEAYPPFLSR